jgi:Dyp-type peroxidase family
MSLTRADLTRIPEEGIDGLNPGVYAGLLADLQGNIIKSHGRDHTVLLFLRWRRERLEDVRRWIGDFAEQWVTSAQQQFEQARHFRESGQGAPLFASLFFSRRGYEALGYSGARLPGDQPFRMGMQHDELAATLADPPVSSWEPGYQQPCDALVSLADDDLSRLSQSVNQLSQELQSCAEILHRENGFVLRNTRRQAIEHFGYVDGISQPLFASHDIQRQRDAGANFHDWDPRAPLSLVLVKDPNGGHEDSYGSYLVLRKLEQNVHGFNQEMRQLAATLEVDPDLAGAYTVGRFKDGTPVSVSSSSADDHGHEFNFKDDPDGHRCPLHAHIRKTNPRGDTVQRAHVSEEEERGHRIVRRAISYGSQDPGDEPERDSGMLFLCFQANIENQFNFMQARWANAPNFVRVGTGPDPLVALTDGSQQWPLRWGETRTCAYAMKRWVAMKGGEYLFAPSISFLRSLAV